MAIDNILHMIANYRKCSACRMIVLVWLMDNQWVRERIHKGISALGLELNSISLICNQDELISRWKNDDKCEWRTDHWLEISLRSLPLFASLENRFDTSGLSVAQIAEAIAK